MLVETFVGAETGLLGLPMPVKTPEMSRAVRTAVDFACKARETLETCDFADSSGFREGLSLLHMLGVKPTQFCAAAGALPLATLFNWQQGDDLPRPEARRGYLLNGLRALEANGMVVGEHRYHPYTGYPHIQPLLADGD